VAISNIFPGSVAQLAGLNEGDFIVEVDGKPLQLGPLQAGRRSYSQWLLDKLESAPSGTAIRLTIRKVSRDFNGRRPRLDPNRSFVGVEIP
jgi:C-terminal processing protease CtpA/Prc